MNIYSNVTEHDLINLRKLVEQQKGQRALKNRNRILKQAHNRKLAESLLPTTNKRDEVKETTQKLGEVNEKSQPENNKPQPAIEHTPHHQRIENNEGVIYDTELENTLRHMKNDTGFFQTYEDSEHGWMWNGYTIETKSGTEVEINNKKYNINPGIQKLLVNISSKSAKSMNDKYKVVFRDL